MGDVTSPFFKNMENRNALESLSIFFMKLAKFTFKLAVFFVVVYILGMQLFKFGHRLFYERAIDSGEGREVVFEIKNGDSVETIAKNLENAGLIDDTLAFKFRAYIYKTDFTPNVYNLKTTMTIKNMLDIFDNPSEEDIVVNVEETDVYQLAPEDNEELESETER